MKIAKLSYQQVKEEIRKLEPKRVANTLTKDEKRLLNNLGRKKNQIEKTINKEKKKGDLPKRNFQEEFEISEGTKSIIRNYLNEDLEIKKLESELEKKKEQMEEFKKMYHDVVGSFDKITDGILEEKTTFERRMEGLRKKIPDDDETRMNELSEIEKEGMKKYKTIQTIGQQSVKKYNLKRKITSFERNLKKAKKEEEDPKVENPEMDVDQDEEEEVLASGNTGN